MQESSVLARQSVRVSTPLLLSFLSCHQDALKHGKSIEAKLAAAENDIGELTKQAQAAQDKVIFLEKASKEAEKQASVSSRLDARAYHH